MSSSALFVLLFTLHVNVYSLRMPTGADEKKTEVYQKQLSGSVVIIGLSKETHVAHFQKVLKVCDMFLEGQCHLRVLVKDAPADEQMAMLGNRFTFATDGDSAATLKGRHGPNLLGSLRNFAIKDAIQKHPSVQHIIMTDLDGIVRWDDITLGAIANAFKPGVLENWDALTFDSTNYYDWWALRCSESSVNCQAMQNCGKADIDCVSLARREGPHGLLPVTSSFNGMELFKVSSLGNCMYNGSYAGDCRPAKKHFARFCSEDCEHVAMNRCLKQNGKKVMMSGSQINTGNHRNDVSFHEKPGGDPYEDSFNHAT